MVGPDLSTTPFSDCGVSVIDSAGALTWRHQPLPSDVPQARLTAMGRGRLGAFSLGTPVPVIDSAIEMRVVRPPVG